MVRRLFAESGEGNILCKSYDSIFEREREITFHVQLVLVVLLEKKRKVKVA